MDGPPDFSPGFRISPGDALVLILGTVGGGWLWKTTWWAGLIVAVVVGHFFFFCNVFRISRAPELAWAVVFTGLSTGTLLADFPGWATTVITSILLAAILIFRELKRPSYHGVGWRTVNPGLPEWWKSRATGKA